MAKRSSSHEWLSTAISLVALIVSGLSAYFTWQSNEAKQEALSMVVRPVLDCRTEYHGGAAMGEIGLCWAVTLANESENRLSIVAQKILDIQDGTTAWIGGFQNLESENGVSLPLPISLDGGEAREIFVRGAIMVPPAVSQAIAAMPEFQNHTLNKLPLATVQQVLALQKLDFIGNKVEPNILEGRYSGFSISPPIKGVVNVLTLTTGRGALFSVRLTYPPDFDQQHFPTP